MANFGTIISRDSHLAVFTSTARFGRQVTFRDPKGFEKLVDVDFQPEEVLADEPTPSGVEIIKRATLFVPVSKATNFDRTSKFIIDEEEWSVEGGLKDDGSGMIIVRIYHRKDIRKSREGHRAEDL